MKDPTCKRLPGYRYFFHLSGNSSLRTFLSVFGLIVINKENKSKI